jgi:hypothetical protein
MKDLISGHLGGAISPAKAALHASLGGPRIAAVFFCAAYYFSRQEALRWYCPLLVYAAFAVGILGFLVSLKLKWGAHQIRLRFLEIVQEQGRAKNLKPVCLEKIFAEFNRLIPPE